MSKQVFVSDSLDKMLEDLSSYLSMCLNSLGFLRSRLEREDILQEIRIRIWQVYRGKHEEIQLNKTYIKKVIYSVLVNEINKAKKESRILQSAKTYLIQDQAKLRDGQAADRPLQRILLESIGELNQSKQHAIKLRLEGFSIGEIAGLNNWTYRKTCLMLYRAIRELKRTLGTKGIQFEG